MTLLTQHTFIIRSYIRNGVRKIAGDSGATFVEYALLTALVAIALTTMVVTFSGKLEGLWTNIGSVLDTAATNSLSKSINGS